MPFPSDTNPDTEVEALIAREFERQTTGLRLSSPSSSHEVGGFCRISPSTVSITSEPSLSTRTASTPWARKETCSRSAPARRKWP